MPPILHILSCVLFFLLQPHKKYTFMSTVSRVCTSFHTKAHRILKLTMHAEESSTKKSSKNRLEMFQKGSTKGSNTFTSVIAPSSYQITYVQEFAEKPIFWLCRNNPKLLLTSFTFSRLIYITDSSLGFCRA